MSDRCDYARLYYHRTGDRRRLLARNHRQLKRWAAWLLANLEWPPEPEYIVEPPRPVCRPTLRLARKP